MLKVGTTDFICSLFSLKEFYDQKGSGVVSSYFLGKGHLITLHMTIFL